MPSGRTPPLPRVNPCLSVSIRGKKVFNCIVRAEAGALNGEGQPGWFNWANPRRWLGWASLLRLIYGPAALRPRRSLTRLYAPAASFPNDGLISSAG